MSTRAYIAIDDAHNGNGGIRFIYSHFDNYPSRMVEILDNNYNTYNKVNELISCGDASAIRESIDRCIFYKDKEGVVNTHYVETEGKLKKLLPAVSYIYLFRNNKWYVLNEEKSEFEETKEVQGPIAQLVEPPAHNR